MKFGTNFGLQKRSSGGSVIKNPYEFDFANPKIVMSGPGTYVLTPLIDGFELELFGNGNNTKSPVVALSLPANLPKDTKFKIEYVYTVIKPTSYISLIKAALSATSGADFMTLFCILNLVLFSSSKNLS